MKTQEEKILHHLQEYGSITPKEAMDWYGIYRLGARIWDLRRAGYEIVTDHKRVPTRSGKAAVVAEYSLAQINTQKG